MEVWLLAGRLVAFAGFMRCDELVKLRCADITFNAEGKIESSKTDQYRDEASWVFVGQVICPVGIMEHYFRMGEIDHSSQAMLFRG